MGTRVKPGVTTAHLFNIEVARFHVEPVEISDLQLTPRGRLQVAGELDDAVVVKYRPVTAWFDLGWAGFSSG